ncbi:MAG: hypothetical protein ACJA1E_001490 [Paracoccaceae bacterium]|jgi:hypothetical protein
MLRQQTAEAFFKACNTGQGWKACELYCHTAATFSCQAGVLANALTLAAYAEWLKGLLALVPDGHYVLKGFAMDEARGTVLAAAAFHGTQTGLGGPVWPTGKTVVSDFAYIIEFEGEKICHITKIWNDAHALRGLGWV